MAKYVTDYTKQITESEKELLNTLSKTIGDDSLVQAIYEDIIKNRDNDSDGTLKTIDNHSGACNSPFFNAIDEAMIKELLEKSHIRNHDSQLQNTGANEIINKGDEDEIVRFLSKAVVMATITRDGEFTGKFAGMTGDELKEYIKNAVNKLLNQNGYIHDNFLDYNILVRHSDIEDVVREDDIFGEDGIIKSEILPTVITEEERNAWNNKYDKPVDGIGKEDLREDIFDEVIELGTHANREVLDKLTQNHLDLINRVQVPYRKNVTLPTNRITIQKAEHQLTHTEDYMYEVNLFLNEGGKLIPYMPKSWSVQEGIVVIEFSEDVPFKGLVIVK